MRLKLHATKTELIWFDRRSRPDDDKQIKSLHLESNCTILLSDVVRNLGVLLDSTLNMTQHISSVARACYFHLRRIRQVKRCLDETCLRILIQALVISRTLQPLASVLHAAARLIKVSVSSRSTLASHSRPYRFQNLPPHVSY